MIRRLFDKRPLPADGEIERIVAEIAPGKLLFQLTLLSDYDMVARRYGRREAYARMLSALEHHREMASLMVGYEEYAARRDRTDA